MINITFRSSFLNAEIVSNPKPSSFQLPSSVDGDKYADAQKKQSTYVNEFGKSLIDSLKKEGGNLFVSPYSVHTALMMVYNGATAETKDVFSNVLRLYTLPEGENPLDLQGIITVGSETDQSMKLFISANSIWIRDSFHVYDTFVSETEKAFNASVEVMSFQGSGAVNKVNQWVNKNTNGLIKKVINKLTPRDQMVLVNTLYFKQPWAKQFKKSNTQQRDFFLIDGTPTKCDMMQQTSKFYYCDKSDAKMVSLPFKDENAQLLIILPKMSGEKALQDVASRYLDDAWLKEVLASMSYTNIALGLPRFKVEYEKELNDALTVMGLGLAFTNDASFNQISKEKIQISSVIHKTVLDIDENGVEAAAATAVVMRMMASINDMSFPVPFEVDRPFITVLYNRKSNMVYFSGIIRDVGGKRGSWDSQEL
ncbi:putative serpin family protein [Monocercomonoides exilis]|uniref:putative serpin family protein n=1 Tax=Monocercomonoides exilis TaxID=2049356 RepID=UPI00355A2D98|nr:putative serpin family protein [Monocercomonoides exilis]|eukprot:MONOS_7658.1-p1 / transcript=MONOS_7658.1 / gene=MONOS_7658 / organism=Monocercomonoides_exilis_PA203 / gene_product=serine protease inhibitor / transcript_product=serine protease inhibitor / location=Mono_scaffold00267:44318-46225(-) / protein_length=423 / sequence_SO=supercontig / SO=protein_coding / is_pseudo=false